jgi:protease I
MKALLVIAPKNFRDEEYFHTKEELEKADIETATTSKKTDDVIGMMGGIVTPDKPLDIINLNYYDAVVFIGGNGSSVYFDDNQALELAKKAYTSGKLVAAICIAPSILANAGLLRGKKATSYPSEEGNLTQKGADYTGAGVTADGRIITADGPASAHDFGKAIAAALNQNE